MLVPARAAPVAACIAVLLIAGCSPPAQHPVLGTRNVAVVMALFSDTPQAPFTASAAQQAIFGSTNSAAWLYQQLSYNRMQLQGDVHGWYTIPDSVSAGCPYWQWGADASTSAAASGLDLSGYDGVIYLFPRAPNCSHGGFGDGHNVYIFEDVPFSGLISHELGHTFGLAHSHSWQCVTASGSPGMIHDNCSTIEYGDGTDLMAGSCFCNMNGAARAALGWIPNTQITTVTASGDYPIAPIEVLSPTAPMLLRIARRDAPGQFYYLEARAPIGFQTGGGGAMYNGVDFYNAFDYATNPGGGEWVVPVHPQVDPSILGLQDSMSLLPGQTYVDAPAGITVTTLSDTIAGAVVHITLG